MAIEVTVRDTESGESQTKRIDNDYVLVTAGRCEVTDTQVYPTKGTHVITVKGVGRS